MSTNSVAVIKTQLGDRKPDYSGKVRDIYDLEKELLIVATDRISAFDHILPNPIPGRGKILTSLSIFWFQKTGHIVPNHIVAHKVSDFPQWLHQFKDQLEGRTMLVKKVKRLDAECVVRGYLAGSGWKEYKQSGKICGISLPTGLAESQKLPGPIFTPATKAPDGEHDLNISFEQLIDIVGPVTSLKLREISLKLYNFAHDYAIKRGIIIADTKFEFGRQDDGQIILIDEALTPDSSRFWDKSTYTIGKGQDSLDKQFIRDYLLSVGWHGEGAPPALPENIIQQTIERYQMAARGLIGEEVKI